MAYQVNIIQIPVPVTGDCTLHLLNNTELKKVEHAVLMDGGLAGTVANIGKAFKNAAATFGDIKLDAIVITHWDADHYQGTQHFFDHKENPANREKYLKTTNKKDQSGKSFVEIGTMLYCSTDGDEAIDFRQRIAPEPDSWKEWRTAKSGQILGIDFFSGKQLLALDDKLAFEHIQKREWQGVEKGYALPALLCLAGNGWVYTRNGPMPCPVPDTNSESIIAITCNIHTKPIEELSESKVPWVPYYCAGDGNRECEDTLAVYFAEYGITVDTMKSTHHGSIKTFSHALFEAFQPRNYLISAGMQHGHPSVALLLELVKYRLRAKLKVFTSILPYWFVTPSGGDSALNVETLPSTIGALEKWIQYQGNQTDQKDAEDSELAKLIGKGVIEPLQRELASIKPIVQNAEEKMEDIDEEISELDPVKKSDPEDVKADKKRKRDEVVDRRNQVEAKEKKNVAAAVQGLYKLLSKTDVAEDFDQTMSTVDDKGKATPTPFSVTITIKPDSLNVFKRVPFEDNKGPAAQSDDK